MTFPAQPEGAEFLPVLRRYLHDQPPLPSGLEWLLVIHPSQGFYLSAVTWDTILTASTHPGTLRLKLLVEKLAAQWKGRRVAMFRPTVEAPCPADLVMHLLFLDAEDRDRLAGVIAQMNAAEQAAATRRAN